MSGLEQRYYVERLSNHDKHKNCSYYVLDMVHDKFSKIALKAYADACEEEFPELAADLRKMI